jgi:hypothetical protein
MQVSGLALYLAPWSTGHPQGLPEAQRKSNKVTKVQAIDEARNPELSLNAGGAAPTDFWRKANGDPDPNAHNAPPSIMQIKITQMLEEQALALEELNSEDTEDVDRDKLTPQLAIAHLRDEAQESES